MFGCVSVEDRNYLCFLQRDLAQIRIKCNFWSMKYSIPWSISEIPFLCLRYIIRYFFKCYNYFSTHHAKQNARTLTITCIESYSFYRSDSSHPWGSHPKSWVYLSHIFFAMWFYFKLYFNFRIQHFLSFVFNFRKKISQLWFLWGFTFSFTLYHLKSISLHASVVHFLWLQKYYIVGYATVFNLLSQ